MGCTLGAIDRFAYPGLPGEAQLVWRRALAAWPREPESCLTFQRGLLLLTVSVTAASWPGSPRRRPDDGQREQRGGRPGRGRVLTWRQRKILRAIDDHVAVKGCSPSNREIAEAADLKSASSVNHHLKQLKAAGFVTYNQGSPRTVRVLWPGKSRRPGRRSRRNAGRYPAGNGRRPGICARKGGLGADWGQVAGGNPIPPLESAEERFPLPGRWSARKRDSSSLRSSAIP